MQLEDAVEQGIRSSAGVVTARGDRDGGGVRDLRHALTGRLKQFGVGLAAAVLIDATIVRGVLLPAT